MSEITELPEDRCWCGNPLHEHWRRRACQRSDIDAYAAILCRTITAEYHRTGSWTVPVDVQERLLTWFPAEPPLERDR